MASVPVEVLHNWVLTISEAKSVLCFSATACYLPRPRSHPNSAMAPYRFVFLSFCPTLLHQLSRSSLLTLTPIPFFLFLSPYATTFCFSLFRNGSYFAPVFHSTSSRIANFRATATTARFFPRSPPLLPSFSPHRRRSVSGPFV